MTEECQIHFLCQNRWGFGFSRRNTLCRPGPWRFINELKCKPGTINPLNCVREHVHLVWGSCVKWDFEKGNSHSSSISIVYIFFWFSYCLFHPFSDEPFRKWVEYQMDFFYQNQWDFGFSPRNTLCKPGSSRFINDLKC